MTSRPEIEHPIWIGLHLSTAIIEPRVYSVFPVKNNNEKKPAIYLCQFSNKFWVVMLGEKIFVKSSGFF